MRGGIKGNRGGQKGRSGRRTKAEEMGLVSLLDKCFTRADREVCIKKLAEDCRSEEFHVRQESRKLLLSYTYGKPRESIEHLGEGGGPIEIVVNHVQRPSTQD